MERVDRQPTSPMRRLGYVLLFLMMFVPTSYQAVKLAITLLLLAAVLFQWAAGSFHLRPQFAITVLAYTGLGTAFVLYGHMRGNPGALPSATVYMLWPLVFLFLASAIESERHLASIFRCSIVASIAIGAYGCLYIYEQRGQLPISLPIIDQGQIFYSPDGGRVTASFSSLSSLLFLLPFHITSLATWPRSQPLPIRRGWVFLAVTLNVALALLSTRRGLLMGLVITPIVVLVVMLWARQKGFARLALRISAIGLVGLFVGVGIGVNVGDLASGFIEGFNTSQSADARIRSHQYDVLMEGFSDRPILGTGIGGTTPAVVRDPDHPWAFELSYVAMLFHTGVVGTGLYLGGFAWLCLRLARIARQDPVIGNYAIPAIAGFLCFLVGNTTNPYLGKFDSMWVIFLPLAVLNVAAARRSRNTTSLGKDPTSNRAIPTLIDAAPGAPP